jgi:hypothetical protein
MLEELKNEPLSIGPSEPYEERTFQEVTYECSHPKCDHVQVVRFFSDQPTLPATCCVECRAGFDVPLQDMLRLQKGMFPIGEVRHVAA